MDYEQRRAAELELAERDREALRRSGARLPAALRDLGKPKYIHF